MGTPSMKLRDRWLDALLPDAAESGWNAASFRRSAKAAGLTDGECALAAPNGVTDLVDHFFDRSANQMLADLTPEALSELRMHERVAACLLGWLDAMAPHKGAVRTAAGRGLTPWGAGGATKRVWATADAIWTACGDTATDYNRYTKRGLLSAVIPSIVLHWLDADDRAGVEAFIARRLQHAMQLGRTGGRIVGPILDVVEKTRAKTSHASD